MKRFSLQKAFLVLTATTLGSPVFASSYFNAQPNISSSGVNGEYVTALYVNSGIVYAGAQSYYGSGGVWVSTNNGATWNNYTTINSGLANDNIWSVYGNGQYIYAGTDVGLSISSDYGHSWTNLDNFDNVHTSNSTTTITASGGNIFVGGQKFGVSVTSNNGASWTHHTFANSGLAGTNLWSLYAKDGFLYAGTDVGLSVSSNNGESWVNYNYANSGLGSSYPIIQVSSIYADSGYLYAATLSKLGISADNGATWTMLDGSPGNAHGIYAKSGYLYVGQANGIFFSSNNGQSWTTYNTSNSGLTHNNVWSLSFESVQGPGGYLFAATGDGVVVAPVPESSTYGIGLGVLALAAVAVRRKKTKHI